MQSSLACCRFIMILLLAALGLTLVEAGEMTFELPDKEKMCFHERVNKGTKAVLEFQVIQGGNYDVDMVLTSPQANIVLYKVQKKQYDRYEWTAELDGDYRFCFSNEFSTFTHKIIYFDLQVGEDDDIKMGSQSPLTAMTQMESSVMSMHHNLKLVIDYQTHHRLRESQGRSSAEDLNERVQYWSIGQTVVIIAVSIGQIIILRSFFTDRKPHSLFSAHS